MTRGAERGRLGRGEVASGRVQSGQLVRDIRGEVFGLGLEMWLWSQLQAGAGDTDLDSGHIEVTADTVKRMIFRSGRVSGQRSRGLRPNVSKNTQASLKYQNHRSKRTGDQRSGGGKRSRSMTEDGDSSRWGLLSGSTRGLKTKHRNCRLGPEIQTVTSLSTQ